MTARKNFGHFSALLSGTVAAQLANLASYPIISRLYTPKDFGTFSIFLAACSVPGILACWRFDLTVPTVARALRFAAFWLCVALSAVSGATTAVLVFAYWYVTGAPWPVAFPFLLGFVVFMTGFAAASAMFLMRHDAYRATAAANASRTFCAAGSQIGLGLAYPSPLSLIVGYCFGFAVQGAILGSRLSAKGLIRAVRIRRMAVVFRLYRRQVSVDIPGTLIGAVSLNLMSPLLLALYGPALVGVYALTNRIAIVPIQLFNDSLAQIFFQRAARAQEERGSFWPEMRISLSISAAISCVAVLAIWLVGRQFVLIYLGPKWATAAEVLAILAPMAALGSTCMSVATAVFVLRRVHWLFLHNVATVTLQCAVFGLAWWLGTDFRHFLIMLALLLSVEYAAFTAWLAWSVWSRDRSARTVARPVEAAR